jgi:hypothetical protein
MKSLPKGDMNFSGIKYRILLTNITYSECQDVEQGDPVHSRLFLCRTLLCRAAQGTYT